MPTTSSTSNDPHNPTGPTGARPPVDLATLFGQIQADLATVSATIDWAEDEIERATRRHPQAGDVLHHAFGLLRPRDIGPGMGIEMVYRGHARELLDRIAVGVDTRPATAAEVCLACAEISLRAPMHGAAAGLYFRMWLAAFPDHPVSDTQPDRQIHYEQLYGPRIDELETLMRGKLANPNRRLGVVDCDGRHHGQPVVCRYAHHRAT